MNTGVFMSTNAFSSLVIDGLVKINDVQVQLTCFRGTPTPRKTLLTEIDDDRRVGGPPSRPPSQLPPPGDLCLRVTLEPEQLGYGRVGIVYPIRNEETSEYCLPPLVIKIASSHRSKNLAREAWFYEEMERIQGASIARCYGFFTAEIGPDSMVWDWQKSNDTSDPEDDECVYNLPEMWSEDQFWAGKDPPEIWDYCPEYKVPDTSSCQDEAAIESLRKIASTRTYTLSVLVLERLGDLLPLNVSLDTTTPDIQEIYSDLGQFGVEHKDVRWRNILAAPSTHDTLVCPYHGHKHQWRIVDFDLARQTDCKKDVIDAYHESHLQRLLPGLTKGKVYDHWV